MPALEKYRKILSVLLPAGLVGASFLLSTTALAALPTQAQSVEVAKNGPAPVAERLAAIRDAVSSVTGNAATPGDLEQLAWWGNGGWGNGGWRNGGFANIIPFVAPWGNGWNNWSNWGNGFRNNWGNGWGNGGWHNWRNY